MTVTDNRPGGTDAAHRDRLKARSLFDARPITTKRPAEQERTTTVEQAKTKPPRTRYHVYIDGAGHVDYPHGVYRGKGDTLHYVLVAVLLNDKQRNELNLLVDDLMSEFFPRKEPQSVEMHAVALVGHHPHEPWDTLPNEQRPDVNDRFRDILLKVKPLVLGQVIDKRAYWEHFFKIVPEPPAINGLRFLLGRVQGELETLRAEATLTIDEDSREIMDLYKSTLATIRKSGDKLYTAYRVTTLDRISNPSFVDSRVTRGLQAADFIAYWTFRCAESAKCNRIRELDPLWASFRGKQEPFSGYADQSVVRLRP